MKITKSQLKEIIREEIYKLNDARMPPGRIGKDYIKFLAVDKKLKELEAAQKEMLNKWKSEKDETRKSQILQQMRDSTKRLQATRKNKSDLERDFIFNLDNHTLAPLDF